MVKTRRGPVNEAIINQRRHPAAVWFLGGFLLLILELTQGKTTVFSLVWEIGKLAWNGVQKWCHQQQTCLNCPAEPFFLLFFFIFPWTPELHDNFSME